MYKKISLISLATVLGLLLLSSCSAVQTDIDGFETSEPSKEQIAALEKIYERGFSSFSYEADKAPFKWSGVYKDQFDALCGAGVNINWESQNIPTENFQNPSETIKRKIGDCEDFAVLFISAARNLGISARFCAGHYVSFNKKVEGKHAWAEIYYNKQWRVVDATGRVPVNGITPKGVSLSEWLTGGPRDSYEAHFFFNEKYVAGEWLTSAEIKKNIQNEEAAKFGDLMRSFKIVAGRDPTDLEQQKIERIAKGTAQDAINLTLGRVPKDFTKFIQPDNPDLKAWMEKQNVRAK